VKRQTGWLVVVESDDQTIRIGHRFALGLKTTIGRSPTSTVLLNNPFTSNVHAHIVARNKRWWIEDQKSKNGTLLNDRPVEEPTVLTTSDIIQIGTIKFLVEFEEPV
jgi:pSer/pThr/pTyr-binding forkhead associated (FHA) protein